MLLTIKNYKPTEGKGDQTATYPVRLLLVCYSVLLRKGKIYIDELILCLSASETIQKSFAEFEKLTIN